MYLLVNASPPKQLDISTLQVHRSFDEEGSGQYVIEPWYQCQGQRSNNVFLLVNEIPPKLLNIAISNFADALNT